MQRNLVTLVSSVMLVALAAALVLVPVPFVTWRPGQTVDLMSSSAEGPLVEVTGINTFEAPGRLLMTTVSTSRVNSSVSLPEAILAHVLTDSDAMPRAAVYPPERSSDEVVREQVLMMDTSRNNAVVAALRAAGQPVTEMPMVTSVLVDGPANDKLRPGDLIASVDGEAVKDRESVSRLVQTRSVGDPVVFRVKRDGVFETVSVVTGANADNLPMAGVNVGTGYDYGPQVVYRIDPDVVGPSAGLMFALTIYDKVTEGTLVGDRTVAGTGSIDPDGTVRGIGGIREKIKGAESAGAEVFLLPRPNCADLGGINTHLRLVPVETLKEAISALQLIAEGNPSAEVPTCG